MSSMPPPPPPPPPPSPSGPKSVMDAESKSDPMKKVNWKAVDQCNLSKDCFWTKQQELPVIDNAVFAGLTEKFSLPNKNVGKPIVGKPSINLRVLKTNDAQNLLILLRVVFKNVPYDQIKKYILQCDISNLNVQFNEGLIKNLPNPHEMKLLQQMKKDQIQLSDVENFVASVLDIERLAPRLECINFKIRYDDMMSNLEPDIKVGIAACEEVIASAKFKKILKIILSIGNFMNVGQLANYNQAVGFELNILPKLNDIKARDNKSTLLQYIVQTIGTKSPELWDFGNELAQVKEAARLNTANIEEITENVSTSSEFLRKEVENRSVHRLCDDKFIEVMSPFSLECCERAVELTKLMKQMQQSYTKVGEVFGFNVKSYPMEVGFTDIKNFENMFVKTYTDIHGISGSVDYEHHENVKQSVRPSAIKPDELNKYTCVKVKLTRLTEKEIQELTKPLKRKRPVSQSGILDKKFKLAK